MEERKFGVVYGNERLLRDGSLGDKEIKHYFDNESTLKSQSLQEVFKDIWSKVDLKIQDANKRKSLLHNLVEENKYITLYQSTSYFAEENGSKKKANSLSGDIYYYQQLEKLADYLLIPHNKSINQDKEHPLHSYSILTDYANEMNQKREIYINDDLDEGTKGIHLDVVDLFNDEAFQQNLKNKRLSEDTKEQLRSVKAEFIERFPAIKSMQECVDNINKHLGLTEVKETKMQKKEQFLFERADNMRMMKEHTVARLLASGSTEEEAINKFNQSLYMFGLPYDAEKQYSKLLKVRNEIMYEMSVVYDVRCHI